VSLQEGGVLTIGGVLTRGGVSLQEEDYCIAVWLFTIRCSDSQQYHQHGNSNKHLSSQILNTKLPSRMLKEIQILI
jgi:hypothetical protein